MLLYLIKKDELNIYDIPISQVTEQYMHYLELMELLDLNVAGEFLVIAATLLQIKSRMLLPRPKPQEQEEEEDPRAELVERLLEYKRFKGLAEHLRRREKTRQDVFTRRVAPRPKQEEEVYFEANVFDLISAFSRALKDIPRDVFYDVIKDEWTVDEKIHHLLHLFFDRPKAGLSQLFKECRNNIEIVATFLAILELIRIKEVKIAQKEMFGEVEIIRNEENIKAENQVGRRAVEIIGSR